MPDAHELAEQIEHAGHGGGGHGGGIGKMIGITMAVMGVMLALCSAMVGGQRTELIANMVEQTGANLRHQTVSSKYCMVQANLVQLHALQPDAKEFKKQTDTIGNLGNGFKKGTGQALSNQILDMQIGKVLNCVVPTHSDMVAFVNQLKKLDIQADAAKEWAESYDGAVEAHSEAAEHYEWAQLCAEVGIVICSVALLLSNKPMWLISVVLGTLCVGIVCFTFVQTQSKLGVANTSISTAEKKFNDLNKDDKSADEVLWKEIESEGPAEAAAPAGEHPQPHDTAHTEGEPSPAASPAHE